MKLPLARAGILAFAFLPFVQAHELEVIATLAPPAVVVRAHYGGRDPVIFAKFQVFAPGAQDAEHQNGLTDRHGAFSFVPDGPGSWRVVIDDEEGHRREITVDIPSPFDGEARQTTAAPDRWMRAFTGVSLLVGLTGFLYGFKARRGG